MKRLIPYYHKDMLKQCILLFCLLLSSACSPAQNERKELNVDSILNVLDTEIEHRKIYTRIKEQKISSLKEQLHKSFDMQHCFTLCNDLFEEYKHYQYDSAYVYAIRSLQVAEKMQNLEFIALAKCHLIFCYTSVGLFSEALEVSREFSVKHLSSSVLTEYYSLCVYLYQNLRDFASGIDDLISHYEKIRKDYHQLVLKYTADNPDTYKRTLSTELLMIEDMTPECIVEERKQILSKYSLTLHDQAVQFFMIGEMSDNLGRRRDAIYYMALSAISDIRSNTHETSAAKTLASYMYQARKIDRATRYIHLAQDDANFYNTRVRKMEINSVLPLIESRRYAWINRQRNLLLSIAVAVVLSLVPLILMFLSLKRKNRSLQEARNEIEQKALELDAINNALQEVNHQLQETNEIKDSYIVQSLYGDSTFVNNVEEKCKLMERRLKTKQYADLQFVIREINIVQERERMSSAFDSAFLKLFPNFIGEYNKLFPQENRIHIADGGTLPTEVRIFALMRLGIVDTALVAKYLNISQNTIYVYKAKVKSKTFVPKDDFDSYIMRIPKP